MSLMVLAPKRHGYNNNNENVLPIDDGGRNNDETLNISDVFDAITLADPSFGAMAQPYVEIIEQPAPKGLRFRYECESRLAGSIPGVNSTSENKTFPTIKIHNYIGQVVMVVSCVTREDPYRPHPHKIVGRERCNKGVCTVPYRITEESNEYQFKNLGIQCVKRRNIADALLVRQGLCVDPFKTGFDHMHQPQSIDLNAVRLCFQVFLPDATGQCRTPLQPVVSDIIYHKRTKYDLLIFRASHCSGTARGGTQIILLCEKVTRDDIVVVFYLKENNEVVWEEAANTILVHKQVAIAFETPAFRDPRTTEHVKVHFQLKRVTDNARSNSVPFEYTPAYPDAPSKRKKISSLLQSYENDRLMYQAEQKIKSEPKDKSPPCLLQYGEQWLEENLPGGLQIPRTSNNPFGQEMWAAQYVQHPSTSPNLHPLSPQMGQNLQVLTSAAPAMSPNMQPMSPGMLLSTQNQRLSSHGQIMSRHGQVWSPHGQIASPHVQVLSPHPHIQLMSPHIHEMSPHGQAMSPHEQVMSPHGQTMIHNLQVMTSQNVQSSLGHISNHLVQQVQHDQPVPIQDQSNQNTIDTETNSSPSLSNLLLDHGEELTLDSGELSALLGA